MAELSGKVGEVEFTVTVTKPTGESQTVQMVGKVTQEQAEQLGLIESEKEI
jgi:hypothetical protein